MAPPSVNTNQPTRNASLPLRATPIQLPLPGSPARSEPGRARRVLLVDDDTAARRLMVMLLAQAGYSVDSAEDGERGWDALCAAHYDLLVTDNNMPRLTGLQLIERLRSAGLTLPVIVVSGSLELGKAEDFPQLSLAAILHKPFAFADLISTLRRARPIAVDASQGAARCLKRQRDPSNHLLFPARTEARQGIHTQTASIKHHWPQPHQTKIVNTNFALPELESTEHPWLTEATARGAVRPALDHRRILIVDDDVLVRSSLAAVLQCEGYEVFGAAEGQAAIKSANEHQPDLVLLDLSMPNMDGWAAFVKLEIARPLIPVIVITARPHQYRNAVKFGVDAFMEKPLNIPVLLHAIRKLTHEPENLHTRRITNPGFVTRLLDNHTTNFS